MDLLTPALDHTTHVWGSLQQWLPGLSNLTFPVWLEAPQRGMFTLGKKENANSQET